MKCPRCQHENPARANFCEECATPLTRTCASCGTQVSPTAKFCTECAHPVPAPADAQDRFGSPEAYTPKHLAQRILTSKSAFEGERKQVTVLFADMKGSMELLADRDPEEARELLDPVLERMMEAVHRYEGTVNQVMGDGIMALFGAPLAHEDHAVRACYAALRMQDNVTRYGDEMQRRHGLPIQVRVGLNSGEVVVRSIGSDLRMDYTAVGQTTHLAARMEQMAKAGSVLITADTFKLVEGYVRAQTLGPVAVRGLETPLEVYELVGASPMRSRFHAAALRGLSRFVGRQPELAALRQAVERARSGDGQLVAVVGEPGVGKSRLYWEFVHSRSTEGCLVLESTSVSYGKATPCFPLIDLLKSYFQIQDQDDERKRREKIGGKLVTLDEALLSTVPAFLALLGIADDDAQWQTLDPAHRRQRTFDACRRLLLRESTVQPLVLVFEDLHWIDSETQAFLDSLVESLPAARILLLVNYRLEYPHRWTAKPYYTQLRIDSLPPLHADELLDALLGRDPAIQMLKRLLVERTDGNPFFIEESVRALVDSGTLVGERGAYGPGEPVHSIRMPATVQALLAARIDRLQPTEKRLLQSAAVIGKNVPLAVLEAIVEEDAESLREGLTHLQATEFLYETSLFPDLEYTFKHALTHEVAYGTLLHDQRRLLHGRIAEAIERLYAERLGEQVDHLAHHAVGGEVWDKALHYCRQAGARAFGRSAHREAVSWFEQALASLGRLPEDGSTIEQGIDLRLNLRYSLVPLGEFPKILVYLREAEALALRLDDRARLGLISAFLTNYCHVMGDLDGAIACGGRALAIAEAVPDVALAGVASAYLGQAYYSLGDYRRAIELARRNITSLRGDLIHERFGMALLPSVYSRSLLVWSLAELGEFAEGRRVAEEGIRIAESVEHPYSMVFAYLGLGRLCLRKGEVAEATGALERALAVCRSAEVPVLLSLVAAPLAIAYALAGRFDDAVGLAKQAGEQAGFPLGRALVTSTLAEAHLQAGRREEGLALARRALELTGALRTRGSHAWALRLLGDASAQQDPPLLHDAERAYTEACRLAEELGMQPLTARCYLGRGLLLAKHSPEEAAAELDRAIRAFRALEMTYWLKQAETAIAATSRTVASDS